MIQDVKNETIVNMIMLLEAERRENENKVKDNCDIPEGGKKKLIFFFQPDINISQS